MGIKIAQPKTVIMANMLRHMLMKRMKMAASKPASRINSFSLVLKSGLIHAKGPFPNGGGARDSSACFNFGA